MIEMYMPALSSTMEEGTIVQWLKEVGDKIEVGAGRCLTRGAAAHASGRLRRSRKDRAKGRKGAPQVRLSVL